MIGEEGSEEFINSEEYITKYCKYKNMKKLYKSSENKVWAGIIGGIGEYLNVDPVVLRVIWVLTTVFTGVIPGLVIYFASYFIIPKKTHSIA